MAIGNDIPNDGVTVIIVSYNSDQTIGRCLNSLLGTLRDYDEVVIVDNASQDRSIKVAQTFARDDQRFVLRTNRVNIGYSAAANQGARTGRNPYIVFLNPDAIVTHQWIERLLNHLKPPKTAAVGPLSDCVAGLQYLGLHLCQTQLDTIDANSISGLLHQLYGRQSIPTKLLIGFCLMIKRKIFDLLGGMDENLFLGNDDLDLSWRLRLKGYGLVIAKDTIVFHEGQVSFATQSKDVMDRMIQESTDYLSYKLIAHYGDGKVPSPQKLWSIDWYLPSCRFSQYKPLTSMIMLTYNQLEYTKLCIDSILR